MTERRDRHLKSWVERPTRVAGDCLYVGDTPAMYAFERPVMATFADRLVEPGCALLEIGFGLGIFAREAQRRRPARHAVVEVHPELAAAAREWAGLQPAAIEVLEAAWQECAPALSGFDAVFYDSFAPEETLLDELDRFCELSLTRLLNVPGRLGVFVLQPDLAAPVRDILERRFDRLTVTEVEGLEPGPEARERGLGERMIVPVAWRE